MAGFKLTSFGGFVPRVTPTLLQDNEATEAVNCKLYSGALKPWYKPKTLANVIGVDPATQTIHREYAANGDELWFAWNTDVDIVPGPLTDSTAFRFYYTGDGYPKKVNSIGAGLPVGGPPAYPLSLGVPAPLAAPTATRVGTGASPETRVYTYTYIAEFGDIVEESAPAAASAEVLCGTGDSVTVANITQSGTYTQSGTTITVSESSHGLSTGMEVYLDFTSGTATDGWFAVTVTNTNTYTVTASASASTSGNVTIGAKLPEGKYYITKKRIYRSVTGTNATQFQYVGEVTLGVTSFSDTVTAAQLGETLQTTTWAPPPADLIGLVQLPNGMLAGFVGRDVYISEPYYPHAWPIEYVISVEDDIVGLGTFGQTLVVVTKGNPYLISGITSAGMSSEKIAVIEPCASKRTIVSDSQGVTYASPNGLVEIGPSGMNLVTRNLMLKDEFSVYSPDSAFAASTQSQYFLFYSSSTAPVLQGCLIFDRNLPTTPLTVSNFPSSAAWVDRRTAALYVVDASYQIKQWEGDTFNRLPFEWKSKQFILNYPVNLGAIEVLADFADIELTSQLQAEIAALQAQNQALWAANSNLLGSLNSVQLNTGVFNGSILLPVPVVVDDRFILIIVYADGQEKHRQYFLARGPKRLPGGYKSDNWQFKFSGNVALQHVKIAETVEGLKAL